MSSTGRETILHRIRQALARPSPTPDGYKEPITQGPVFSVDDSSEASLRARFREEFESVQGEWHEVDDLDAGRRWLRKFVVGERIHSLLAPESRSLRVLAGDIPGVTWVPPDAPSTNGWVNFAAGLTTCEALVAESGTICVSATQSGRAMSVLPPLHVVVASADQIVPDIETSMRRLRERYDGALPSSLSWITGPSRTADIEKILVLGAHGPRRLVLLLLPAHSLA